MNKKILSLLALPLVFAGLIACGSGQSSSEQTDSTAVTEITAPDSIIPYRLAEAYFAASDSLPSVITTAEEQEKYLGMGTTMNQHPTEIDWTKEFVIPIVLPSTSVSTEVIPVRLVRNPTDGALTLTYRIVKGEDMKTAEMRPFAAVIVARECLAPVQLVVEE